MRKSLLAILTATVMSVSFSASAATVAEQMQILAKNYQVVTSTSDKAELVSALQAMRNASETSSTLLPPSLDGKAEDSEEVKQYRQAYTDFNAIIDEAIKQAEAGDVAAAKVTAEKLAEIRNTNHKLFR